MSDTHADKPHPNYPRIYFTLLILLAISVAGPYIGIKWLTLVTAFGIAVIKANLVIQNFMHLKWERRIAKFVLIAAVLIMGVFFYGVAPDIMRHTGENWTNNAAIAATARGIPSPDSAGTPKEQREREEEAPPIPTSAEHEQRTARDTTVPSGSVSMVESANVFKANCTPCHGAQGMGNGNLAAMLNPKPANFTSAAFWQGKTDAELVKAIREGGASVGRSSSMPAWGSMLSEAKARQMIAYLKTLKR